MTMVETTDSALPERLDIADDLAFGAEAIANVLGLTTRQVYHLNEKSHLPIFRIGSTICARRSTLQKWFDDQERAVHERVAAKNR